MSVEEYMAALAAAAEGLSDAQSLIHGAHWGAVVEREGSAKKLDDALKTLDMVSSCLRVAKRACERRG